MKRILVFGLCLLAAHAFAAGRSSGKSDSIDFVSMWNTGEPVMLFLEDVGEQFKEETGVAVNFTWGGRDVLNKIRTKFLSGDVPDVVEQGWSDLIGALVTGRNDLLLDLEDVYQQKPPGEELVLGELIDKNIIDLYRVDDKIYLFPFLLVTSGFFYDKSLFQNNGLEVPQTWDDFIANNEMLKSRGISPLALDGTVGTYTAYYLYWALQRVLGDGAFYRAAGDETGETWLEPGYLEAAKLVSQISVRDRDFFQPGYQGTNWPAAQSAWALNSSGSILMGSWIGLETKELQAETFRLGFYPFPAVAGGRGRRSDAEVAPFGVAIPKGAKNAELAKQFFVFMMSKERQEKFIQQTNSLSPRLDINYPEMLSDLKSYLGTATSYHGVYDNVHRDYPEWFSQIFTPLGEQLIFGTLTPEDFVSQMAEKSRQFWQQKG